MAGDNVFPINPRPNPKRDKPSGPSDTGGNGTPPGGGGMEKRVEKLEQAIPEIQIRLVKLDLRLDNIERQMATKADLQEMSASLQKTLNDQTWKFIGLAGVLAGLSFTAAKLIS